MIRLAPLLLLLSSGIVWASPLVVEEHSQAVSSSGVLAEDIGIETLGGVFTPLLKSGCKSPCAITQVFSTADDGQTEIKLFLFRGKSKMTKGAHSLGSFVVVGVPPEPRGMPQVAVTFAVEGKTISLSACDKRSSHELTVKRNEF